MPLGVIGLKRILIVGLLSIGLLSACGEPSLVKKSDKDSNEKEQGLVQVAADVEKDKLNGTLEDLHKRNMKIIDIKLSDSKGVTGYVQTVYTVIYEEPAK